MSSTNFLVRLSADLAQDLRTHKSQTGVPISEAIRRGVAMYLSAHKAGLR